MSYSQKRQTVVGIFATGFHEPRLIQAINSNAHPNLFFKQQGIWALAPEVIKEVGNVLIIDRFMKLYAFGPNMGEINRAVMMYTMRK